MVLLNVGVRYLASGAFMYSTIPNIAASPAFIGSSIPAFSQLIPYPSGEFPLGSGVAGLAVSSVAGSTLVVQARTDERGNSIDIDMHLKDNLVRSRKQIFTDTPFHHLDPNLAKSGLEVVMLADSVIFANFTFPADLVSPAIAARQQQNP